MAINMLSPGVQVEVQDFSHYTVEQNAAQVGLVGGATKGPTGPQLITSRSQAIRMYGYPTSDDYGVISLLACLNKCSRVYYNRIIKEASNATAGNELLDKLLFRTLAQTSFYNGSKIEIYPSNFDVAWIRGTELSYDDENYDSNAVIITSNTEENIAKYGIDLASVSEQDRVNYFDIRFTSVNTNEVEYFDFCTLDTVVERIDSESKVFEVIINPNESTNIRYADSVTHVFENGAIGGTLGHTEERDDIMFFTQTCDSTVGGWTIKLSEKSFLNTIDYSLYNSSGDMLERFTNLVLDSASPAYIETFINANSTYITCDINEDIIDYTQLYSSKFTFVAGNSGIDGIGEADVVKALDDYSNPEIIVIDLIITPGWFSTSIINKAISVCEHRQDCMYIVDPPFGLTPQEVVDWSNATGNYNRPRYNMLNSSSAALYWPWCMIYEDYSKTYVWMPPSPIVAAQYAYSDNQSYPWFAPAGINRGLLNTVVSVEMSPSQEERDLLYGNNNVVNPIVNFKNTGIVIWGQKTTLRNTNIYSSTFSALNRVNVRRLTNYLKRLIQNLSMRFVFDPNDSFVQQKWISLINTELTTIQTRRGIYDFAVEVNITAEDIENNRMPGTVKFKPTKAAEYIPITFMIMRYTDSF